MRRHFLESAKILKYKISKNFKKITKSKRLDLNQEPCLTGQKVIKDCRNNNNKSSAESWISSCEFLSTILNL